MNWIELLLGILVIAGIYIIFHFDPRYKRGIILGVSSAVLLAVVMIYFKGFVQRIRPETVLTYQLSGAFIILTLFMPFYLNQFPTDYLVPGFKDWMWLLALSWFCSVLAFQLTGHAIKKLSAFTVNLTFNLEPVYGIILAFAVFGESRELSWSFFIGLALIAASLIIHVILLLKGERKIQIQNDISKLPTGDR